MVMHLGNPLKNPIWLDHPKDGQHWKRAYSSGLNNRVHTAIYSKLFSSQHGVIKEHMFIDF